MKKTEEKQRLVYKLHAKCTGCSALVQSPSVFNCQLQVTIKFNPSLGTCPKPEKECYKPLSSEALVRAKKNTEKKERNGQNTDIENK